jgi:hypothetical protein
MDKVWKPNISVPKEHCFNIRHFCACFSWKLNYWGQDFVMICWENNWLCLIDCFNRSFLFTEIHIIEHNSYTNVISKYWNYSLLCSETFQQHLVPTSWRRMVTPSILPWWWKHLVSSKHWYPSTKLNSIASRKTIILTFTKSFISKYVFEFCSSTYNFSFGWYLAYIWMTAFDLNLQNFIFKMFKNSSLC